jgi:glutaminase
MAATLANGGVNPKTGRPVVPGPVVRQVLSVMSTCGMYDGAGDWMTRVGIPAKSGVAGGLIGALPGEVGVATFSPRLDRHGNSVRGVDLFTHFTNDMDLHIMSSAPAASSTIRSAKVIGSGADAVSVIRLQGAIRFSGAERVVRAVTESPPTTTRVVLELSLVNELDEAASRMFESMILELTKAGYRVFTVDPDGVLNTRDVQDLITSVGSIEELVPTG